MCYEAFVMNLVSPEVQLLAAKGVLSSTVLISAPRVICFLRSGQFPRFPKMTSTTSEAYCHRFPITSPSNDQRYRVFRHIFRKSISQLQTLKFSDLMRKDSSSIWESLRISFGVISLPSLARIWPWMVKSIFAW